jgi:UDP-galactopyranose mutase
MKFAVIGCGFSGSIIASELAKVGYSVDLFEARDHIGGNCFTKRDKETGIMLHSYGPHIFHTDDKEVWNYVNNFTKFMPYVNRVKTLHNGTVYSMPINLHTINQFFRKALSPSEAEEFILGLADGSINNPMSFEEQALKFVGKELYEAFLKGYTIKQWGIDPIELPASILKRLPVRFNYDDNYFSHAYQGIPENGYTPIFEKLLDNKNIKVYLKSKFEKSNFNTYDHIFYTGPLDAWFDYKYGRLG